MCSIMGYCGSNADFNIFKKGFDRTITRGPDESRIIDTGNGFLGFHRLAIMGLSPSGMQPFELDGSFVVCNGEIYGFEQFKEQLSEKYTFQSESDCEILLPLYREYKTDMFAMLDAEFACIIYDGETGEYIAARDPVGIRPLYYGFDEAGTLLLASEPKNLVGLAEAIMPFPPGHYYKNGELIDDSIVRGNTIGRVVQLLRNAGAKEVHIRISSPMFLHPCYYGTDIDSEDHLIACKHTVSEIAEIIGADSLGYFPLEKLRELTSHCSFCSACFDGCYPTAIPDDTRKDRFEKRLSDIKESSK